MDWPPKILLRPTLGPGGGPDPNPAKNENGIFGISAWRGFRKSSFAMCLVGEGGG